MKLSELIYPDLNTARSINLERDRENTDVITNYRITAKTREALGRFVDSLQGERVSAWSLTGPYGMGKSSFVNYLMAITRPLDDQMSQVAMQKLKQTDADLYKKLADSIRSVVGK